MTPGTGLLYSAWPQAQDSLPPSSPRRGTSGITVINVTVCQDRLQQTPNAQSNQPADKVIH